MRWKLIICLIFATASLISQSTVDSLKARLIRVPEREKISLLNDLAFAYRRIDPDKSVAYSEEAYEKALKTGDNQGMSLSLFHRGMFFRHRDDYQEAIRLFNRALILSEEIGDDIRVASIYSHMGFVYREKGDYLSALDYLLRALKIRDRLNDRKTLAYSLDHIGGLHSDLRNYDKAMEYHKKSLAIREEIGDTLGMAYSYNKMGRVSAKQDDYQRALQYHLESLRLRETQKVNNLIAHASLNVGQAYLHLLDHERALIYFQKARLLFQETKNKKGRALSHMGNGDALAKMGQLKKAQLEYETALDLERALKDNAGIIEKQYRLAALFLEKREYRPADVMASRGLALAEELVIHRQMAEGYRLLSDIYEARNEPVRALNALRQEDLLEDILEKSQAKSLVADMEVSFHLNQKEREIDLLKKDRAIQELKINKQRLFQQVLLFSALGILFISGLAINGYLQKKGINAKLRLANEQIHKQKNALAEINDKQTELLKKLKKSNASKDRFFSVIAHDIKSPLQVQLSGSRMLSDRLEALERDQIREIADELKGNAHHLFSLLENLLKWAKVQIGAIHPEFMTLDLTPIVAKWLAFYRDNARDKGIELSFQGDGECTAWADPHMIDSVLNNLISNAIKFSSDGGRVTVGCRMAGEHAELFITDTGVGISPERLPKLFHIEENVSTRGTGDEKGTGLGLVLCKEFIELNRGEIHVESEPGRGTRFTVTLQQTPDASG